jgi:hypothetical protein
MTWVMDDKEFEAVFSLPAQRRYAYLLKRVVDWERIWSLSAQEGWALSGDDEGHELVPVWPHERFAAACAEGSWRGYEPQAIDLSVWMERWIPGMQRDQRMVCAFPTPGGESVRVAPERFEHDLKEEFTLYE